MPESRIATRAPRPVSALPTTPVARKPHVASALSVNCPREALKPQSPYAETKLKEEALVTGLVRDKGLRAAIFRATCPLLPTMVLAPSCWKRPSEVRLRGIDVGSCGSISTIQPKRKGSPRRASGCSKRARGAQARASSRG